MQSLPFLVQPRQHPPRRVGTLDSGILEIPVLGGLTVEESNTITQLLADDVSAFVLGAQLADAIAQAEDVSQPEAFAIIERVMSGIKLDGKAEEIRVRYAERLEGLSAIYAGAGQRNIEASITAIIRHRLDRPEWGLAQTKALPRVLLQDIWQLIVDEQAAENLPANRPTDEELKKQRPVSGSRRTQTGKASSGGFAMPTPAPSVEPASAES
jgi:hypothetical protein